jgi:peptidoglycan/LPS O-acetylase OafA/YrhL
MKFLDVYKKENLIAKRNFGLDLIRSIAILLVLVAHLGIEKQHTAGLELGGIGVEIFFVLSGFLIGQIIVKTFSKSVSMDSILQFWIRRWFRTLPLYYLVITLKFVFVDHSLGPKIIVYYLFLQNNLVGIDFMRVTWSLVIEEWFYLTLPVFLLIFFYKRELSAVSFTRYITGFIITVILARLAFVLMTGRPYEALIGNFPFRLDSLMCGVLIAHLKLNYKHLYDRIATVRVFIITALLYAALLYWFGQTNLKPDGLNSGIWFRLFWFTVNSMFIALLIPFVESKVRTRSGFFTIIISCISIFSYAAYLIHMEVYGRVMKGEIFSSQWFLYSLLCIGLTLIISAFIYGAFEKPMTDLRDKFRKKSTHAAVESPGQTIIADERTGS